MAHSTTGMGDKELRGEGTPPSVPAVAAPAAGYNIPVTRGTDDVKNETYTSGYSKPGMERAVLSQCIHGMVVVLPSTSCTRVNVHQHVVKNTDLEHPHSKLIAETFSANL